MNAPLTVDIDGVQVRLTDCTWVLWSPDGYPAGVSRADARTRTAAQAMRVLHDKPLQAALDGWRVELMTHDRWCREVMPLMCGDKQPTNQTPQQGKPMTDSKPLPTWDEMTDLDKGAALLHVHKRLREGRVYAIENYPVEYFDHPQLVALGRSREACDHAASATGKNLDKLGERIGWDEYGRLYDLALDADRKLSK